MGEKDYTFVIKNNKTNQFISIDNSSGGYPYDNDIFHCHKFYNKEKADEYKKIFHEHDWTVCILHYTLTELK